GAQEKIVKLPFGDFPGSIYMGLATSDTFTHGWDLAKATGQSTDLDPELAGQLLDAAALLVPDQFRGDEPMPFGPKMEAPANATAGLAARQHGAGRHGEHVGVAADTKQVGGPARCERGDAAELLELAVSHHTSSNSKVRITRLTIRIVRFEN